MTALGLTRVLRRDILRRMFGKDPGQITRDDIGSLIRTQVSESKSLDYKRELPGWKDGDKKEFLADVCAFANTSGGHLIYGVEEKREDGEHTGLPDKIVGCPDISVDEEIRRLDELIRDGIEPRVAVDIAAAQGCVPPVLIVRIRQSWVGPHMVKFKGTSRFYARTSAGKYQLDLGQIRRAFLTSEDLPRRLREFRGERISRIIGNETPVEIIDAVRVVLHFVPISAMDPAEPLDPRTVRERAGDRLHLMLHCESGQRFNLDGFVRYHRGQSSSAYVQVFRSGAIESVLCIDGTDADGTPSVHQVYEECLVKALKEMLESARALELEPPCFVMVSLLGVRGARLQVDVGMRPGGWNAARLGSESPIRALDRDHLLMPEAVVETLDADPPDVLRPAFDCVWQAAGLERSFNYDDDGNWLGN